MKAEFGVGATWTHFHGDYPFTAIEYVVMLRKKHPSIVRHATIEGWFSRTPDARPAQRSSRKLIAVGHAAAQAFGEQSYGQGV